MSELPVGTVTFLFSDVEGSTRLLRRLGPDYHSVLEEHRRLVRDCIVNNGGHEMATEGDSFFVAFGRASDAVRAAVDAQVVLSRHPWPPDAEVRVRIGIHTGEAALVGGDYVGLAVHQAQRISAAAHGGQILLSSSSKQLAGELPETVSMIDLGAHALKDFPTPEHLFQIKHPDLPGSFPPVSTAELGRHNLPVQITRFIGRESEIEQVVQMVRQNRIVTLTGPGGCGKTRLAIEAVSELVEEYRDGVWIVNLASVTDADVIYRETASALGMSTREEAGLRDTLQGFLRSKQILIVLDNCEHLLEGCRDLAAWLIELSPEITVLATTREALNIGGEAAWRVPSLSIPDSDSNLSAEEVLEFESVSLFIDRARLALPSFDLNDSDAPHVAEICRRLDGIPLGIELAAARINLLSPREIAERLNDRFRLLTGGSKKAIARQQTLQALIDWSYDLLTDQERTLLARLGVFMNGFSLSAAERVGSGGSIASDEVLQLLSQLVQKSLVVADRRGERSRYSLLETIRQYAGGKLVASGEALDVRDLHLQWSVELAESEHLGLWGASDQSSLQILDEEHDNLRSAHDWAVEQEDASSALRLASALARYWWIRGDLREGLERLETSLALPSDPLAVERVKALGGAGLLCTWLADVEKASTYCLETVKLCRELKSTDLELTLILALGDLSHISLQRREFARAQAYVDEGLQQSDANHKLLGPRSRFLMIDAALADERGDHQAALQFIEEGWSDARASGLKVSLVRYASRLGDFAWKDDDHLKALSHVQEALTAARESADATATVHILNQLAWMLHLLGRDREALPFAEEALTVSERIFGFRDPALLHSLGSIQTRLGFLRNASATFAEAIADPDSSDSHFGALSPMPEERVTDTLIQAVMVGIAAISALDGDPLSAARLYGAAEGLGEKTDWEQEDPIYLASYQAAVDSARAQADTVEFESVWREGKSMARDEAIRFALATLSPKAGELS
ncbi:MAG: tetratricopeptide repeat protein [Actinobacteria bacterium]|nr:tetratricopeptide repeat protein [Actinomycetota bacterium]